MINDIVVNNLPNDINNLSNDIMINILTIIGQNIMPHEFYKLRKVSKQYRDIIDMYNSGFYLPIKNTIGIINHTYTNIINMKLDKNLPVTMSFGFKIIGLDDWSINPDVYVLKKLPYPKWTKDNSSKWVYKNRNSLVEYNSNLTENEYVYEPKFINIGILENNITELYKNKMEDLKKKISMASCKKTLIWFHRNGELQLNSSHAAANYLGGLEATEVAHRKRVECFLC